MGEGGFQIIRTLHSERIVYVHEYDSESGLLPPHEAADIVKKSTLTIYVTKESGKGTGLGLAIVAQVVEDHNGYVGFDDVPGGGTRFHVALPRQKEL